MNLSVNKISPSFSGIHVQISKMNSHQEELATSITHLVNCNQSYLSQANDKGIDIYILPGEHKKDIKLKFLDIYDEKFIKNDDGTPLEVTISKLKRRFDAFEQFKQHLAGIKNFRSFDSDDQTVLSGQTELLKLRPELYDDILDDLEENKDDEQFANLIALSNHMASVEALFRKKYEEF